MLASMAHIHRIATVESVKSKATKDCFKVDLNFMSFVVHANYPIVLIVALCVGERLVLKFVIKGSMTYSAPYR
jgi:hypothetical protein